MSSLKEILDQEDRNTFISKYTPYKYAEQGKYYKYTELGNYFKYKAKYLVANDQFEEGINACFKAMNYFAEINSANGIIEISDDIFLEYDPNLPMMGRGTPGCFPDR
ncbi:hypothetical protein [Brevibacillus daliensis]|uniref:hypothetical protein n=1 Tax=Brevibacillus daliensis TaxID=2892995 RepID=UPI001E530BEE|nr:hypothetical protein [Brevibacillus daliensis]